MGDIIRKRKNGRELGWYIRWTENGKRIQRASHQTSYAMAKRMLLMIEARVARGEDGQTPDRPQLTVAELCARYLAEYESPRIKDLSRYREQSASVLKRVLPHLGQLPAGALLPQHVASARDMLLAKYSPGTVRTTLIPLGAALSFGVKQGLLSKNPVAGLARPRPTPHIEWLDADEVRRLLATLEDKARTCAGSERLLHFSLWVAVALSVYTGLRRGEVFGLRWQDVDAKTQRLTIARSYEGTPKSGLTRHLRLPVTLGPLLNEWRGLCPKTAPGLVCPARSAGRWQLARGELMLHRLVKLQEAAGCRPLLRPWHALRHTFASHFVMNGGNLLTLQKVLGHADVQQTLLYAHLAPEFLGEEMNKVKF